MGWCLMSQRRCPDCNVAPGEPHLSGCDVERCAACGRQRISCGCGRRAEARRLTRLAWTGTWPGVADCQRLGWYGRRVPGVAGWVVCNAADDGATEDLNRLMVEATWNVTTQRWETT